MKFLSIISISTLLLLTSCGKEIENTLPGTWITISQEITNCPPEELHEEEVASYSTTPCDDTTADNCLYQEINFADGIFTYTNKSTHNGKQHTGNGSGTYMIEGDELSMCEDDECIKFSLQFDGNRMTMSGISEETFDGCTLRATFQKK